jgi:hypothetical protein
MITIPDMNEMIRDLDGQAVAVRLGQASVAPAQGCDAAGARAIDGCPQITARRANGEPAGFRDRIHCRVCVDKYGINVGEFGRS